MIGNNNIMLMRKCGGGQRVVSHLYQDLAFEGNAPLGQGLGDCLCNRTGKIRSDSTYITSLKIKC